MVSSEEGLEPSIFPFTSCKVGGGRRNHLAIRTSARFERSRGSIANIYRQPVSLASSALLCPRADIKTPQLLHLHRQCPRACTLSQSAARGGMQGQRGRRTPALSAEGDGQANWSNQQSGGCGSLSEDLLLCSSNCISRARGYMKCFVTWFLVFFGSSVMRAITARK